MRARRRRPALDGASAPSRPLHPREGGIHPGPIDTFKPVLKRHTMIRPGKRPQIGKSSLAPESGPMHHGVSKATYWKVVGPGSIASSGSAPMRQATIRSELLAPGLAVTMIGSGQPVVPGETDTMSSAIRLF